MKCYLLAAACAAALVASPAAARDHSGYFGIEVGAMWANKSHLSATFPTDGGTVELTQTVKHKLGVDGDLIAGYDFGMFRAEFEAGHKWAKHDSYDRPTGAETPVHGTTSAQRSTQRKR